MPELTFDDHSKVRDIAALKAFESFRVAALESLKAPLSNLSRWSLLSFILVGLSAACVLVGVVVSIVDHDVLQIASTSAAAVSSLINGFVATQLRAAREDVVSNKKTILNELRIAGGRLFGEREPSLFYT
jgi:hypothetical protein